MGWEYEPILAWNYEFDETEEKNAEKYAHQKYLQIGEDWKIGFEHSALESYDCFQSDSLNWQVTQTSSKGNYKNCL